MLQPLPSSKTFKMLEEKLSNCNRQLDECNSFKESIQMKLEETLQSYKSNKSQNENEITRLKELIFSLKTNNEKIQMQLEESLQKYNNKYEELNNTITKLKENILTCESTNKDLRDEIETKIKELNIQYLNKRAEMWGKMRDWMKIHCSVFTTTQDLCRRYSPSP
mgnify:CR=1 FL=1